MNIKYIETEPIKIKITFVDKELEDAHSTYINHKRDILHQLSKIVDDEEIPTLYRMWIDTAYKFIEEVK